MGKDIHRGIIDAVADARDVDPGELDLALYEYIDLEALAQLADHDGSPWTLSFELPEHQVTVASDGSIQVDSVHEKLEPTD